MDGWVFSVELRGALAHTFASAGEAAAVVQGGRVEDVSAAADRAGVAEGMAQRAAVLRLASLRCEAATEPMRHTARERLRLGLSTLADEVRCESGRKARLRFLALPAPALRAPWADACAHLVPAYGFALEGAAGPSDWAADALLAAGRAGSAAVGCLEVPGGRLFVGDWRDLAPAVMTDVAIADQERLRRQGVRTLGELAAMPAAQRRLLVGPLWARRLDGEGGEEGAPPAGRYAAGRRFDEAAADASALSDALSLLAAEIAQALMRQGEGVRHLALAVTPEKGPEAILERAFLFPLPAARLAGAAQSLLWTRACPAAPVAALRLIVAGGPVGWAQARLTGRRLAPPAWALPAEVLGGPGRSRRLRREARLSLWDPLRGGLGDAPAR